jgi:hypothetical protein
MNILTAIPVVFEVVRSIEQLLPEGKGKEKFDAAFAMFQQLYNDISVAVPVVTALINTAVALLNLKGEFKKS